MVDKSFHESSGIPLNYTTPKGLDLVDKIALSAGVIAAVPCFALALFSSSSAVEEFGILAPFFVASLFWVPAKLVRAIFKL